MAAAALILGAIPAAGLLLAAELYRRTQETGALVLVRDPPGLKFACTPEGGKDRGYVEGRAPTAPLAHRHRVICVGDSVTFGYKVQGEEAWPHQLGQLLGETVEVLNFGVVGYDVEQAACLMESRVPAWKPDLVVWGHYQNDQFPSQLLHGRDGSPYYVGTSVPGSLSLLPTAIADALVSRSALFRWYLGLRLSRVVRDGKSSFVSKRWYEEQLARIPVWATQQGVPLLVLAISAHVLVQGDYCELQLASTPGQC